MSMIFKFTVLSNEDDSFLREYEIPYDTDLLGLHDFICDDLEYDKENFCSFFGSNGNWDKLQEYTLADMQDDDEGVIALPMKGTLLGQIIRNKLDRLIFMFDIFAGRSLFMELTEAKEAEDAVRYPRVVSSEGDPPSQLDAGSLMSEESPFEDAMEDFSDFESYDDDSLSDDF